MNNMSFSINLGSVGNEYGTMSLSVTDQFGAPSLTIYSSCPKDMRLRGILVNLDRQQIERLKWLIYQAEHAMNGHSYGYPYPPR